MDEKQLEGICPSCGKPLQIPAELESFSCMYCGHRMTLAEFTAPQPAGEFDEAVYRDVCAHMIDCVAGEREMRLDIRRKTFDRAFLAYEERHGELFRRLDAACAPVPEQHEALFRELACRFLDDMAASWEKESAIKRKTAREDDKITIAIFLSPMILHLNLSCGEALAKAINDEWLRRHPKTPYYIGTYEALSNGFRKKLFGLCFITTAVCTYEGKPDDCAELTAFRAFRDGYLAACPDGAALIREYYDIAPAIVSMIDLCTDPAESYGEIRARWLAPCYRDLQEGRMADCKARYTDMVRTLEARFLH